MAFTAPLSTVLSNRFGYQPVVMLGGFLMSLGTITSAFTNSANEMYITIGIIAGTISSKSSMLEYKGRFPLWCSATPSSF
uniref:Major facilitator superfamily (MFS) profile domain-containing protein n=1 Tax=Anguilla anguilla TaxID=7936 RepID=A0A0E9WRB2_ANGAN